ncbi:MAG TPA: rubrerythrin family protein [Victivallales bacterium]|nr:rubrerythrin family protein [Victivallales bacterium]HPO89830.1 rubrerythrin family protein [Victivallales bacterium]HRR06280.1 rubrerythrin family protein [Victivallales bacterium]HRR28751.1 rubrerythrin family protein [Victivallales bacterium]HRU01953.1 rubrerythrin family protein [Victivallales bacterium]
MKSLKGTKTEQNLLKAFAGESQARNRYSFFASKAREEGYEQIAAVFELTAEQERIHAKNFFKFLEGGDVEITATYPAGKIGTTAENLLAAAEGEKCEWGTLYPDFAKIADEEGFTEVANKFRLVSVAEKAHEERYRELLANIKNNLVFERKEKVVWQCRKCGYTHNSEKAPAKCPTCGHPQAYFEIKQHNW